MLRDYQQRSIDDLYAWLSGNQGHPCLVLPTGSGKSHIVAALCKDAVGSWPDTRILMLTHQKELIEQNYEKLRLHWPNAPVGIYSASVGRKEIGQPITFAGIQSIREKASELGHIDLVIVDECHLISHKQQGSYRTLLDALLSINPNMRVIGLTATPWRLGHGKITDGKALFDDLLEPVGILELVERGFLSPLRSKVTQIQYDLEGVKKRGGEYIEKELMARLDTEAYNIAVAQEIVAIGEKRKSWLLFCTGVQHSEHMAEIMRAYGIPSQAVTGATPKGDREHYLNEFKAGRIRCLTNANVLTTGFDAPDIDLIAMLRPTMSPSLYVQMAGRGMRVADGKEDCLVLDFAGNVAQHGPLTDIVPPRKAGEGKGEAPIKVCDNCYEIVSIQTQECPACGTPFPVERPDLDLTLRDDDIMQHDTQEMTVSGWRWFVHTSRASGKQMLKVKYYGGLAETPVTEYVTLAHDGWAGQKAIKMMVETMHHSGVDAPLPHIYDGDSLGWLASEMEAAGRPPSMIKHKKDGRYRRVIERTWS